MSKDAIDAGHRRFLDAMRANDASALMQVLTDDVVFFTPGQEPPRGKAAVREWFEGVVAQARTTAVEVPERDVVVTGDWGIERGRFVWTLQPVGGGAALVTRGSFLAIWRRDEDGAWRVASDIWNSTDATS